ncbi:ATP-binding protein [Deinococcus frigens]|uniref:ATP-binding protein n=1 Tax=Deinococcus frigens TaxID=249403 RepID=UPI000495F448|nr:AAA family ATPase [Deinococcus frigens]
MDEAAFIGRRAEQERLRGFLERALAGAGGVAFVTGEAGNGKTALVQTFVARSQAKHETLRVAVGECNAQGRFGDPYLPFREVLSALTGARQAADMHTGNNRLNTMFARSVQLLVEVGPDLVGAFVPGASLVARIGRTVIKSTGWLDELTRLGQRQQEHGGAIEQSRIFEQYANVLEALAKEQPLLIVLDDLQWADEASVGLLFHLSRRLAGSRVLMLGTYRPDEIATARDGERHPLEKVLAEIKRYAGDVTLDLSQTGEAERLAFVKELLDLEPNRLDAAFRQQLYAHTGGHPLFTVELLRTLQERGQLVRDADERWVAGQLDWSTLPARVEGVIEERIGRLGQQERDLLDIASVEGAAFTAEVVAKVTQRPLRPLIRELSQGLEKQHRLVTERGELVAGRSRLSAYGFTHALFQKYLYGELGQAQRRLLHGEVGEVLEELCGPDTAELSSQLAWHLDLGGEPQRAARYYLQAGERAVQQGAPARPAACWSAPWPWPTRQTLKPAGRSRSHRRKRSGCWASGTPGRSTWTRWCVWLRAPVTGPGWPNPTGSERSFSPMKESSGMTCPCSTRPSLPPPMRVTPRWRPRPCRAKRARCCVWATARRRTPCGGHWNCSSTSPPALSAPRS